MPTINSPLRYPGGKTKALRQIIPYLPARFQVDDSPAVRRNLAFAGAHIYEWQLQYGMNNFGRTYAPKGKELFITNHPVPQTARAKMSAHNG